jgi:hypothetical protein
MRLSDFIESTLYEIALGVERARYKARDLIAINPSRIDGEPLTEKSFIDFDVSILVGETEETKKGGSVGATAEIKVASIGKIGGTVGGKSEGTSTARAEQTHRVSFKVPVYMNANYQGNPATEAAARAFDVDSENGVR